MATGTVSPEVMLCKAVDHCLFVITAEPRFPKDYPTGCLLGCVNVSDCLTQDQLREQVCSSLLGLSYLLYICQCKIPINLCLHGGMIQPVSVFNRKTLMFISCLFQLPPHTRYSCDILFSRITTSFCLLVCPQNNQIQSTLFIYNKIICQNCSAQDRKIRLNMRVPQNVNKSGCSTALHQQRPLCTFHKHLPL